MPDESIQKAPAPQDDPQSLLFETSPYGSIDAIVEHDQRTVYFYLNGQKPFGMRACWVRNLQKGPFVLNVDEMQQGRPPMLPRTHVMASDSQQIPNADDLEIVWFEEGNAAALRENGRTIAVIPPWSGTDGFHGYSAECVAENDLCWPLPPNPQLEERIDRAANFWASMIDPERQPFGDFQPQIVDQVTQRFGGDSVESKYFAIDGGQFPPRGLIVFRNQDVVTATTVAMSFVPQPNVELSVNSPHEFRRIELGIQLKTSKSIDELSDVWGGLSSLAGYPWRGQTWIGDGHTVEFKSLVSFLGDDYSNVGLVADNQPLAPFRDDPINILWLAPMTLSEQKKIVSGESNFASLGIKERIRIDLG